MNLFRESKVIYGKNYENIKTVLRNLSTHMVGKYPEGATNRCFAEYMFFKILKYSRESSCVAVCF